MSNTTYFLVKWAALTVVFGVGIASTFLRVRDDGNNRLTRTGRVWLGFACLGFVLTGLYDRSQRDRDTRERVAADSTAQAKADQRTRQQERVLREESLRLRLLQHEALRQMDSAASTAGTLVNLQQTASRDIGVSLALSQRMSDSLRRSMTIARDLADSLHDSDVRAAERTRETVATVERSTNPLYSLDADFAIQFSRRDSLSGRILDALYARSATRASWRVAYDPAELRGRGVDEPVFMPENLIFYFWHGDDCATSFNYNDVFLSARRQLSYQEVRAIFDVDTATGAVRYVVFRWQSGPFEIRANRNVSVADLNGACMRMALGNSRMMGIGIAEQFWAESDLAISSIRLPYGRFANVQPTSEPRTGSATRIVRLYVGS